MASTRNETGIVEVVSAGMVRAGALCPERTKEEWAAHELKVAEDRKAENRKEMMELWAMRKRQLVERGLTERHLEFAFFGKGGDVPAMRAVRSLSESDDDAAIAILSGNVGCGKTQAAHQWLLGIDTKPMDWQPSKVRRATAAWFARTSRYCAQDKFDLLSAPERLVLDDLGVEFNDKSGSFLVDLDELMDLRWASKKQTIICTNMHEKDFCNRYGRRLIDRARGTGNWCDVKHKSMRGAGEKA